MNQASIMNDINAAAQELVRDRPITLLKNWDKDGQDTASLLRFYPAGSSKTARFDRYAV